MPSPVALAAVGLVVTTVVWVGYMARIPGGRVPARPLGSIAGQLVALGLVVAGVVLAARAGLPLGAPIGLAVPTGVLAGLFLYLLSQRKTPLGDLGVAVGDPLPAFTALDGEGRTFDTASLAGQRVLLKFFRGHW